MLELPKFYIFLNYSQPCKNTQGLPKGHQYWGLVHLWKGHIVFRWKEASLRDGVGVGWGDEWYLERLQNSNVRVKLVLVTNGGTDEASHPDGIIVAITLSNDVS